MNLIETLAAVKDRRRVDLQTYQAELDALLRPLRVLIGCGSQAEIDAMNDGGGGMVMVGEEPDLAAVMAGSAEAAARGDYVVCVFEAVPKQFGGLIERGEPVEMLRNEFEYFERTGACRLATEDEQRVAQAGPSPLFRRLALLDLGLRACAAA